MRATNVSDWANDRLDRPAKLAKIVHRYLDRDRAAVKMQAMLADELGRGAGRAPPPGVFAISVRDMRAGIVRNMYNHYESDDKPNDPACPPCRHEIVEGWKLDQCADCGAALGPARLAEEQRHAREE